MSEQLNNEELNNNTQTEETVDEENSKGRFYTQEEIDMLIQKSGDKRISQYQKSLEKKQREAEKLHNMNEDEKRIYQLEERERALSEKETELQMLENKSEGVSILAEKGLDTRLISFVLDSDADKMYDNIKMLERAFKTSVKKEVEARLKSPSPKKIENTLGMSKEQFKKMSLSEKQQLFVTDRELYNEMTS